MAALRSWGRSIITGVSTQKTKHTVADHRLRGAPAEAANADLVIRTVATSRGQTWFSTRQLRRRLRRAEDDQQQHRDFSVRQLMMLSSPKTRYRTAQINDHDRLTALAGHMSAVIPVGLVTALIITMGVNDPGFVYNLLRTALDVPDSAAIFDFGQRQNLVALAGAVALFLGILGSVSAVGRTIASILFLPRLARSGDTAAVEALNRFSIRQRTVIALGPALVLGALTFALHTYAATQFESPIARVMGTDGARTALVWTITMLPVIVLILEVVAAAPPLKHARQVARWAWFFAMRQRIAIRREQRLLKRFRRSWNALGDAVSRALDRLGDTALRAAHEYVDAGLGGHVQVEPLTAEASSVTEWRSRGLAGMPVLHYGPYVPAVSYQLSELLDTARALPKPQDSPTLARAFHDLRADPDGWCGLEAELSTSHSCVTAVLPGTRERPSRIPSQDPEEDREEAA